MNVRQAALDAVDEELVKEKRLTAVGGTVSPAAQKLFGWERQIALPTAGVIVKGCLDDCDVCEPSLDREIELELERKQLENELLKKQIDAAREVAGVPLLPGRRATRSPRRRPRAARRRWGAVESKRAAARQRAAATRPRPRTQVHRRARNRAAARRRGRAARSARSSSVRSQRR